MTAGAAAADTYSLSYTFGNGVTDSAVLTGTLESDGNTFDITGVQSASVSGTPYSRPLYAVSTDDSYGFSTPGGPTATLDKSKLDFFLNTADEQEGLLFAVGDRAAHSRYFTQPTAEASPDFGGISEAFNPSSYTASYAPTAAGGGGGGPEPSTWALMMVGVFGAGAALRRRQGALGATLAA